MQYRHRRNTMQITLHLFSRYSILPTSLWYCAIRALASLCILWSTSERSCLLLLLMCVCVPLHEYNLRFMLLTPPLAIPALAGTLQGGEGLISSHLRLRTRGCRSRQLSQRHGRQGFGPRHLNDRGGGGR